MSVTVLAWSTFRGYQPAFVLERAARARSSSPREVRRSGPGGAPSFDPRASTLRAPQKPILLPKLRIRLADFPCLHCSLSARGFSPRRPDAVNRYALDALGLLKTGSDFQGTTRRSPDATRTGRAFRPRRQLLLRTTCFRSRLLFRPYKEKRTLPGARVVVSEHGNASPLRPGAETPGPISRVEARESVLDSLSGRRLSKQRVLRHSPVALRRGYTAIDRRSRGALLLFGLRGSRLNVCYCHRDLRGRPLQPHSRATFCATGLPAYSFDECSVRFHLGHRTRFASNGRA